VPASGSWLFFRSQSDPLFGNRSCAFEREASLTEMTGAFLLWMCWYDRCPTTMRKRLRFVCFALAILCFPDQVYAQFAEARHYVNAPVGVNQLELAYAYAHSNASIDTELVVAGGARAHHG
jgi:hypothetical protein